MTTATTDRVLVETIGASEGMALRVKQAVLVVLGIAVLTICAQIKVPMWPVPVTMGTFAGSDRGRGLWPASGSGDDSGLHGHRRAGV